jgi:hypothetical protein
MLDARQFVTDYPTISFAFLILGGLSAGKILMDMYEDYQAKQQPMAGLALQTNPYAGIGALQMGAHGPIYQPGPPAYRRSKLTTGHHMGAIDYTGLGALQMGAIKKMGMIHY